MSETSRLTSTVEAARASITRGERPRFHVTADPAAGGAVDVRVIELPIIHLFVPDLSEALDGARVMIGRALGVDQAAFDVALATMPPR